MNQGFLGTAASASADLILLLEVGMGLALLAGAVLARRRRFRAHAICQSAVLLLNLIAIVLFMFPSFHDQVAPRIPSRLGRTYYALATTHAVLGTAVELAGLYIVIAVGTKMLPERWRIRSYKPWMRSVLAAWWTVLLLGVATYARWYLPRFFRH